MRIKKDDVMVVKKRIRLVDEGWIILRHDAELIGHAELPESTRLAFSHLFWTTGEYLDTDIGLNFVEIDGRDNGPEFLNKDLVELFKEGALELE